MKCTVRIVALGTAFAMSLVGTQTRAQVPPNREGFLKYDIEQEVVIRKQFAAFTRAWNAHDAKAMAGLWALDGDHVEPDLHMVKGRDEIEALFKEEHTGAFRDSELTLALDSVWMVTEKVALVDGAYYISGVKGPDGKKYPPRKGHLTGVLLRERDHWWVVASRSMMPAPNPWRETVKERTARGKKGERSR